MINTLLHGFIEVQIHILDWFLSPIENAIMNSSLGANYTDFINAFNYTMNNIRGILPWVIDATGIPKSIFALMFGVFIGGLGLRISAFTLKLILKWWDRIVA